MIIDDTFPSTLFYRAKVLAQCLFDFPYVNPESVDQIVHEEKQLMDIIVAAYPTTVDADGNTQPTTIDPAERIRLQAYFKMKIYELLDNCLAQDPEYAPAFLLYPRVAEFNSRAVDRQTLIKLYERLLPAVENVKQGTRAYSLVEKEIKGPFIGTTETVEDNLAAFHYAFADLYMKANRFTDAICQYEKAAMIRPSSYAGAVGMAYAAKKMYKKALQHLEKALTVHMIKSQKDLLRQYYSNIQAAIEGTEEFIKIAEKVLAVIEENPGILQKDIYGRFPAEYKSRLSSMFGDIESEGLLTRKKRGGSTYQLILTKPAADVLIRIREIYLS